MRLRDIFLYILLLSFLAPARGQETAGSSIATSTRLLSNGTKKVEQRVYDNGLGDIVQEVQSFPGSSLPSVVTHHEYDEHRRKTRTWLPVTTSGSGFVSGSAIASLAQSQYSDSAPFSHTVYDGFLPSQPSAQHMAGAQWQSHGKAVSYSEEEGVGMILNTLGEICILDAKFLRTQTVDEDGCPSAEYTDMNGRVMISETSQGMTYYVYNAKGDICYVIPPVLSSYLVSPYGYDSGVVVDTDTMMQKYAYIYRYDSQRHCIYKKLPGCEPVYYVYDRSGACILTQDGNLRQRGEWAYSIPDKFGRPCISGVCSGLGLPDYSSEPLHTVFVCAEYDGVSVATGGYAVSNLALGQQSLYSAIYYDGYTFIGNHGVPTSLTASAVSGFPVDASIGRGLQTGSATAILSDGSVTGYTYSAMYYDSRYNVAQVRATNHLGGTDVTCTSCSYTGKPQNVKILHSTPGAGTTEMDYAYTYDGADRVGSYTLSVAHGGTPATSTMAYEYDGLGRLSKVTRPFIRTSASPDITYAYDLHGWLTDITTNSFQEELFYADGLDAQCFNGNISTLRWKGKNDSSKRGYNFTYNDASQLTMAAYGEGDALTTNSGRYSESVAYDAYGNVSGITRYGKSSPNTYGLMDNLTLTYDGYRLAGVSETVADNNISGSLEYKRANGSQYIYDGNGNLVADKSRGMAYITYDSNSNPQQVYFTNGNVTKYLYSAAGQKLRVVHYTAKPNITRTFGVRPAELTSAQILYKDSTDYLLGGSLVMANGTVDKYFFDGGFADTSPTNNNQFLLYYYNKDHLGNNREVVAVIGSVKQVTNYYPFGAPYTGDPAEHNTDFQPYKYNGKELDKMHGLNTYDYGARQYNPVTARWDRMDPLCEKYYSVSPYAYCHNNPVMLVDPDGSDDFFNEKGEFIKRTDKGSDVMVMSGEQYKNITEVDFSDSKSVIENIGSHYLAKADKSEFSLTASSTGGNIPQDAVFSNNAGTPYYNIYLTNGHVNKTLGNCYNFECVTYHESTHRYDSSTYESNIGEVNAIIRTANECPAWGNASEDYIHSQASYAERSLKGYAGNKAGFVNKLNDAFVGYATFSLKGTNVSHVNYKSSLEKWEIIGTKRQ